MGEHQIEATRYKVDNSFTLAHIGSQVLAASKRLMNRVFNLASDMGSTCTTPTPTALCATMQPCLVWPRRSRCATGSLY